MALIGIVMGITSVNLQLRSSIHQHTANPMKCPNCNVNLVMTERSGIEIDYCPDCRGVWLDRGELDKIIERSAPSANVKTSQ
jgi:ribosomal protein L37AE/L43A